MSIKDITFVVKNFPAKNIPGPGVLTHEFDQTFKGKQKQKHELYTRFSRKQMRRSFHFMRSAFLYTSIRQRLPKNWQANICNEHRHKKQM